MNPLLSIKLNGWESYIVSQLLGSNWRVTLWDKVTAALDTFVAGPGTSIAAFVTSKIDSVISTLFAGEPFLALIAETALNSLLPSLISAAEKYVEAKIDPAAKASLPNAPQGGIGGPGMPIGVGGNAPGPTVLPGVKSND